MKDESVARLRFRNVLHRVKRFRIRRHHVRHVSIGAVAAAAIVVFFVLGAALRLAMGPVSLGPFSGRLRQSVLGALPGLSVRYDKAAIEWSRDEGRVNLIVIGARLFDSSGRMIAEAPKAEIGVSAAPLLKGQVQIRRIALVGVQLALVRAKDGSLHLGVERNQSKGDILERIREAIQKSGKGAASLERFAVRKARIAFYDERTGLFVVAPRASLEVANENASPVPKVTAGVDANVEIGGKPAHVTGTIRLPRDGGTFTGDVAVTGLSLPALARSSSHFAFLQPFDLTTDVSASFIVDRGTKLRSADLRVGAHGVIGGFGSPLAIKNFRFIGRYDGAARRLLIEDAAIEGDRVAAHAQGVSDLTFASGGGLERAQLDIHADRIAFTMPDSFRQPVNLGGISLTGAYTPASRTLAIDRLSLSGSPVSGNMSGRIVLAENEAPEIDLQGKLDRLTVGDLVHYWPLRIGEGARAWIAENVSAGRIGPISIAANIAAGELDKSALPDKAVEVRFPIEGASASYVRGMTPVTHANGSGVLTGDTFRAQIVSAKIGSLAVSKGSVIIPKLHVHGTAGDIRATVRGSVRDVLSLINEKPLQYPSRFHIKPAAAGGTAVVDADFHVPMLKNIGIDRVPVAVKGAVNGLSLPLGKRMDVSNGDLTFQVDNSQLHAQGNVTLGSTPVEADWTEKFKAANDVTTNIAIRATLDDAARAALKLDLGDFLNGPVEATAELQGHRGVIRAVNATVDLTPAIVSLDEINYRKPAGAPAIAQISAKLDPDGAIRSAGVSISGKEFSARGDVMLNGDGTVVSADFPSVRAGPANDFALNLARGASGGFGISIHGRSMDGSAFGRPESEPSGSAKKPESETWYRIVAKLDRLVLKKGAVLAPFVLDATATGNRIDRMTLNTGMSKGDSVTASIAPMANGRRLTANASDAGALLKGLLGLTDISGGRMALSAAMPPIGRASAGPDYAGTLVIRDFKIENQPFFARLFAAGSLGGLLDLMRGSGIAIDELEMPFSAKNGVLKIRDAHASGPSIGISADGYIDRSSNKLSIRGAMAPIYGLNSVLGALPIVGGILVPKEGEGILGVTYRAYGDLDEPKIGVNPLSILTPGIFRGIFEGRAPTAPKQANPTPQGQSPSR